MGQIVLAQRDLDFHARVGVVAENLHHARHRFAMSRRLLDELGDHDLAGLRPGPHVRRHEDVLADALVLGHEVPDAAILVDAADDLPIRALDDIDDRALGTTALVDADHAHGRAIAMQRLVHFLRAEEHVRAAVVGDQKTESVRMTLHLAGDQVELGDDAELTLAVGHQLSLARHRGQAALERLALGFARDAERPRQLIGQHRHATLAQHVEDLLAARNVDVARLASCAARGRAAMGQGSLQTNFTVCG